MHEVKNDAILMKEYLLKGQLKKFAEVLGRSWISKKGFQIILQTRVLIQFLIRHVSMEHIAVN